MQLYAWHQTITLKLSRVLATHPYFPDNHGRHRDASPSLQLMQRREEPNALNRHHQPLGR